MRVRYSSWDGTQDIGFTDDDLMEHVAQEMLETGDLQGVLRRLCLGDSGRSVEQLSLTENPLIGMGSWRISILRGHL